VYIVRGGNEIKNSTGRPDRKIPTSGMLSIKIENTIEMAEVTAMSDLDFFSIILIPLVLAKQKYNERYRIHKSLRS
jgi:hypothetical protein